MTGGLSILADRSYPFCEKSDLEHIKADSCIQFVAVPQGIGTSDAPSKSKLQACLARTILYRAMEAFGDVNMVEDLMYVKAENEKLFFKLVSSRRHSDIGGNLSTQRRVVKMVTRKSSMAFYF
jgi:hypothetical protein